ncbi:MAG: hypothetical protein ACK55Z_00500, partial [bacterium]
MSAISTPRCRKSGRLSRPISMPAMTFPGPCDCVVPERQRPRAPSCSNASNSWRSVGRWRAICRPTESGSKRSSCRCVPPPSRWVPWTIGPMPWANY